MPAPVNQDSNPLRMAALAFAAMGIAVLPLVPLQKIPHSRLVPHGLCDASSDQKTVAAWWDAEWGANVGIRCDSFVVVDVDPRHDGGIAWSWMLDRHGDVPRTWQAETQGLGLHVWFKASDPRLSKKGQLCRGIDWQGRGGYVVVPPSRTATGAYEWVSGGPHTAVPIADVPDWLVEVRLRSLTRPAPTPSAPTARDSDAPRPEGFPEGERDSGLWSRACAWAGRGVPYADAERAILESAALCTPPVPEAHALDRLRRAYSNYEAGVTA